jgi:DNA-binding IclR family transcriptional regulator
LAAIEAPFFGRDNELAAVVGLQGPSERFRGSALEAAGQGLTTHAGALSRSLGFVPR